jgi:hypothetical protein
MPKSDHERAADAAFDAWMYGGRDYDAAFNYAREATVYGGDPDLAAFYPTQERPNEPEPDDFDAEH